MANPLNQHRYLQDPLIHESKGFFSAENNTYSIKSVYGESSWEKIAVFGNHISIVSPLSAPPTTNNSDVYILNSTGGELDVNNITWQSGTTVRYSFSGSPDLSIYSVGWNIIIKGEPVAGHNGVFLITAINNSTKYIEVSNPIFVNGDYNVTGSSSVANITHLGWNGAIQNSWVKYSSLLTKWGSANPIKGTISYNKTTDVFWSFNGSAWVAFNGSSSPMSQVKYIVGTAGQSGCDHLFSSAANNTEQAIQLGSSAIIPADCAIVNITIKAITGTGSQSVINVGKTNSTDDYVSDVDFSATNYIKSFSANTDPSVGASSIYLRMKPLNNWNTLNGKWKIWINYINNL
jgi:hypothetical protein